MADATHLAQYQFSKTAQPLRRGVNAIQARFAHLLRRMTGGECEQVAHELHRLMLEGDSDSIKVKACEIILSYALGKPKEQCDDSGERYDLSQLSDVDRATLMAIHERCRRDGSSDGGVGDAATGKPGEAR